MTYFLNPSLWRASPAPYGAAPVITEGVIAGAGYLASAGGYLLTEVVDQWEQVSLLINLSSGRDLLK